MMLLARFALNLIFDAPLLFFFSVFLVRAITWIFRIKHPRLLYLLGLAPLLRVLFAPIYTLLSRNWYVLHNQAIIGAPANSRNLMLGVGVNDWTPFFYLTAKLQEGTLFSIGDICAECLSPIVAFIAGTIAIMTIAFGITKALVWLFQRHFTLKSITLIPSQYEGIFTCENTLLSPCIIRGKIVISKTLLSQLTSDEIESIVAHEKTHMKWFDPLMHVITEITSLIFWWVPFKTRFIKAMSLQREIACDRACLNKDALMRSLQKAAHTRAEFALTFSQGYHEIRTRLKAIKQERYNSYLFLLSLFGTALCFILLAKGRLGIC